MTISNRLDYVIKIMDENNRHGFDIYTLLGLILVSLFVLQMMRFPFSNDCDDAFITYRYVNNFLAGNGLVYNPGEMVFGLSSPLYGLLLGTLIAAGLSIYKAARLIAFFSVLGMEIVAVRFSAVSYRNARAGLLAALFLFTYPPLAALGISGMETMLFLFILTLGFSLLDDHPYAALVILGIGLGIRIEAVVALGIAGLYCAIKSRRNFYWPVFVCLVLVLMYLAAAYLYYGTMLPSSVSRKMQSASSISDVPALIKQFAFMAIGFCPGWFSLISPGALVPILAGLGLIMMDASAWKRLSPLLLFSLIYIAAYSASGKGYAVNFPWYFAPPLLGLCFPAGFAISKLLMNKHDKQRSGLRGGVAFIAIIVIWMALAYFPARTGLHVAHKRIQEREKVYAAAGEWLKQNTPAKTRVAGHEIGAIGYFSERPVLDLFGLVSPEVWPLGEAEAAAQLLPDYIVMKEYLSFAPIKSRVGNLYKWIKWRDLWFGAQNGRRLPTGEELQRLYAP